MVKTTWIGDVQNGQHDGQTVELMGWIKRTRGNNNLRFIVLRDSTGTIQCVGKKANLGEELFDVLKGVIIETSVIFTGTVRADERAEGGHELDVSNIEVVGPVNSERPFPITEADKRSIKFQKGVSCPRCWADKSEAQKERYAARQRQMELAEERGEVHLGQREN